MRKNNLEKSRMKKLEVKLMKEKGITLIALIITVIIMLILAGVAISTITQGDSLFERTQRSADAYSEAVQNEADQITSLMNEIDVYLSEVPQQPAGNPVATTVRVGDYINYDAGTWTTADFTKITSSAGNPTLHSTVNDSTVNDSTTGNQAQPDTQGQFGGFKLGQSRNLNSTPFVSGSYGQPRTAGWRVWDKDETTGVVTLISAGHPETYYHAYGESVASINILRNRNCSMYENSHAQTGSAHILTGQEAAAWYNKQYGTSYTIVENGEGYNAGDPSTFYYNSALSTFSTAAPIEVLENGSYYWLASAYSANSLYCVLPDISSVSCNDNSFGFGVRLLVSLKSDILLEQGTGDGSVDNPWRIVEN